MISVILKDFCRPAKDDGHDKNDLHLDSVLDSSPVKSNRIELKNVS